MAREGFANDLDGVTTLTAAISGTATLVPVALGTVGPVNAPFRIRIDDELLLVTSIGASPWSVLARGIEGSTATTHASGAAVTVVLTAVGLVTAIEDRLRIPLAGEALGTPAARFASVSTQSLDLPVAPSKLLGRGDTAGSAQELTLGTGLAIAGTTVSATPPAAPAVTPSHLLGRGDTAGVMQEITLGAGLSMTGTTVNAATGSALPTAPLRQVLISQGPGVAPIFSDSPLVQQVIAGLNSSGGAVLSATSLDFSEQPAITRNPATGDLTIGSNDGIIKATLPFRVLERSVASLASLTGAAYLGTLVNISDSTVTTPGAVIAGGGTFHVLARYDGTNWKVVA